MAAVTSQRQTGAGLRASLTHSQRVLRMATALFFVSFMFVSLPTSQAMKQDVRCRATMLPESKQLPFSGTRLKLACLSLFCGTREEAIRGPVRGSPASLPAR